jgi:hypothetical protein
MSRMPHNYCVYRLDRANQIVEVEWLTANNDEEAVAAARSMKSRGRREVWHDEQLIASIPVAADEEPSDAFWL